MVDRHSKNSCDDPSFASPDHTVQKDPRRLSGSWSAALKATKLSAKRLRLHEVP